MWRVIVQAGEKSREAMKGKLRRGKRSGPVEAGHGAEERMEIDCTLYNIIYFVMQEVNFSRRV